MTIFFLILVIILVAVNGNRRDTVQMESAIPMVILTQPRQSAGNQFLGLLLVIFLVLGYLVALSNGLR